MSPMSWKSGSQDMPRVLPVVRNARWIRAELCSRLPCVSTTPRGAEVEPEVYWRNATVSAPTDGCAHSPASDSGTRSVASSRSTSITAPSGSSGSSRSRTAAVVSATVAPQSATMSTSRSTERGRRLGGYTGTATARAYRQPTKETT